MPPHPVAMLPLGSLASVPCGYTVPSNHSHSVSATWSLPTLSPSLLLLLLSSQQPGEDTGETQWRIAILKMNKLLQRSSVAHCAIPLVRSAPSSASSESIQPSVPKAFLKPHPLSCSTVVFLVFFQPPLNKEVTANLSYVPKPTLHCKHIRSPAPLLHIFPASVTSLELCPPLSAPVPSQCVQI